MSNTLGLDDDLDPIELQIGLEEAFALKFSDEEAVSVSTVGDIYDLLHSRLSAGAGGMGPCVTSMAFYRLRRVLRGMYPAATFRPDTPMATLAGSNARAFLRSLENDSGLRLPGPEGRWISGAGCLLLLASFAVPVVGVVMGGPQILYVASVVIFAAGVALLRTDPGVLPKDCQTLGGLTRRVSALSYGRLAQSGGAVRPKELWDAMVEVLSAISELPKADIRRETRLSGQTA